MHDIWLDYEGFGQVKVKPKFWGVLMKFQTEIYVGSAEIYAEHNFWLFEMKTRARSLLDSVETYYFDRSYTNLT